MKIKLSDLSEGEKRELGRELFKEVILNGILWSSLVMGPCSLILLLFTMKKDQVNILVFPAFMTIVYAIILWRRLKQLRREAKPDRQEDNFPFQTSNDKNNW